MALRRIAVLLFYAGVFWLIYQYGGSLYNWLQINSRDYFLLTAGAAVLFSLFPIIPYPIIGGIIGAAYGAVLGSLLVWFGSAMASIIMFLLVRYGFQDVGRRIINKYAALERITVLFEKNAFFTLFVTRLIPVIPSIIVNCYAALSRIRLLPYAVASSLGKIPSMILFATIGTLVTTNPSQLLYAALVYGVFLIVFYVVYRWFKKRAAAEAVLNESPKQNPPAS